ncbi:bifunctional coenzyme A synthase [Coccinella septempunctata]|uniref:bifunctional coenzyme A synthase n=1 Tax=Coccinella septempunctata TaxID=41139 RepID=UPI001D08FAAC|nr:bifunctional coenzyme A synthase [Coccinella septempunctata]
MAFNTGLLVLTNFKQVGSVLSSVQQQVSRILYIQFLNALSENTSNIQNNLVPSLSKYSREIHGIYSQAARHCKTLDVRVLLSGLKYDKSVIKTQSPIDVVIFDKRFNETEVVSFLNKRVSTLTRNYKILTLDNVPEHNLGMNVEGLTENVENKIFKHGVIGGTFDRMHSAHKLLLSELALRSDSKMTIGITDDEMIKGKILSELIENLHTRVDNVRSFMTDICPEVPCDIVPISDPFGPSIVDPTMDMLVVSRETLRGGQKVNEVRASRNLSQLYVHPVELLEEPESGPEEEKKISSSTMRMRLLGTLLKPVVINTRIPARPYVIGLTGGIASGKSGVSGWLKELGALIIDADKIGHGIYAKGKPCHKLLVDKFGDRILADDGEIDRKKLGAIVFRDRNELEKLNSTVWPEMLKDILEKVKNATEDVIVIDAAILLQADWQNHCHEVWTTVIPKDEAVKRLIERNNLNEEQALLRIQAQPLNSSYVEAANVVFCTLWSTEYTRQQVHRAWKLLQDRMEVPQNKNEACS